MEPESAPHSTGELWQAFKNRRDATVRERLALAYLPLVRTQTRQMARRLPPSVKADDLEGYGMIGLLEAIDRFDPDRGIPFEAFARLRIRGAMYDYLRTLDRLPRPARRQVQRIQAEAHALTRTLGRTPTEAELARAVGVETPVLGRVLADAQAAVPSSLDEVQEADRLPDALARDAGGDILSQVERDELAGELWHAIDALPVRHKLIIGLYYCEGLTLGEIGRVLGVTESRVSQLRGQALESLRTQLALRAFLEGAPPPRRTGGRAVGRGSHRVSMSKPSGE